MGLKIYIDRYRELNIHGLLTQLEVEDFLLGCDIAHNGKCILGLKTG